MDKLPVEVLHQIFDCIAQDVVSSTQVFYSACLTSKAFYELAHPRLYHTAYLSDPRSFREFQASLQNNTSLKQLIRHVFLADTNAGSLAVNDMFSATGLLCQADEVGWIHYHQDQISSLDGHLISRSSTFNEEGTHSIQAYQTVSHVFSLCFLCCLTEDGGTTDSLILRDIKVVKFTILRS